MAEIAELSYDRLAWCTNWYLREETLRPAIAAVVELPAPPAAEPVTGAAAPCPRPTASGSPSPSRSATPRPCRATSATARGVTFYTWTSDQFSQYGTKVIPATVRDATYVLDEILDNETELTILEHTTDTAGYTELVFALFDLLGLQFAPADPRPGRPAALSLRPPRRPTATWGRCSRARSASAGSSTTGTTCCGWPGR